MKVIIDLKVGDHIPQYGHTSVQQISNAVGADEKLLVRVLRVVMARYVFSEPRPGLYSHTSISWAMQAPHMRSLLLHRLDEGFQSASQEPNALRQNGYREPEPGDPTGFNIAFEYTGSFWEYISHVDPQRAERFYRGMQAVPMNALQEICDIYPFADLVHDGGLLVDVGGGLGSLSEEILRRNPGRGLRCIVQDRRHMIPKLKSEQICEMVDLEEGQVAPHFTLQLHDFFHVQPVKGRLHGFDSSQVMVSDADPM